MRITAESGFKVVTAPSRWRMMLLFRENNERVLRKSERVDVTWNERRKTRANCRRIHSRAAALNDRPLYYNLAAKRHRVLFVTRRNRYFFHRRLRWLRCNALATWVTKLSSILVHVEGGFLSRLLAFGLHLVNFQYVGDPKQIKMKGKFKKKK